MSFPLGWSLKSVTGEMEFLETAITLSLIYKEEEAILSYNSYNISYTYFSARPDPASS